MTGPRIALAFAITLLAIPLDSPAQAQDYPSRPVKVIVPFGAGGPADVTARQIGGELSVSGRHGDVTVQDVKGRVTLDLEHGDASVERTAGWYCTAASTARWPRRSWRNSSGRFAGRSAGGFHSLPKA